MPSSKKNLLVKWLCGRCLSVRGPLSSYDPIPPPLTHIYICLMYTYSHREGGGGGDMRHREGYTLISQWPMPRVHQLLQPEIFITGADFNCSRAWDIRLWASKHIWMDGQLTNWKKQINLEPLALTVQYMYSRQKKLYAHSELALNACKRMLIIPQHTLNFLT